MDEIRTQLKRTFADVFSMYVKAANFHWNVEGADFFQYHKMFDEIYSDVYGSLDPLAEHIRAVGTYVPATLSRITELTAIDDVATVLPAPDMIQALIEDNDHVIAMLTASASLATKHNLQGLLNFLGGRIEQHNKWAWFLRATTK